MRNLAFLSLVALLAVGSVAGCEREDVRQRQTIQKRTSVEPILGGSPGDREPGEPGPSDEEKTEAPHGSERRVIKRETVP